MTLETQRRLELTNNFKRNSKNMDDIIDQLKQRIFSLEDIIKSFKIEKGHMLKSISDLQMEVSKYDQILKQAILILRNVMYQVIYIYNFSNVFIYTFYRKMKHMHYFIMRVIKCPMN